jgi:phosphatidate cytidylyltransferase
MNKRYLGALLLSPLLIFLFLGGVYLKYFALILSLVGMYEFYKVVKEKNINAIAIVGYILCIAYYILLDKDMNYHVVTLFITFTVLILLCIPVLYVKYNFIDVSITILGFLYVGMFFSFIVLTNQKTYGNYLVWLIFISSWLCDTTAYYVGRAFGKTKVSPKVSPKKTVEGSLGGLLGSAVACTLFGFIISRYNVNIPLYHYFAIGIICGVFCQFGDLAASSIKRYVGVKDYSNLIPGHGGILDRFDSILFSSAVVYFYLTLVANI